MILAAAAAFACNVVDPIIADPEIEVSPATISADYTSQVYDIAVTCNTTWSITRTDAEGNEISWVKVDKLSGKGSCTMHFKVLENPDSLARAAVVTFTAGPNGEAVAYVDVAQALNPDPKKDEPDEPDPVDPVDPEPVVEGCTMPVYQYFDNTLGLNCTSGAILISDTWGVGNATVNGNVMTFSNGVKFTKTGGDAEFVTAWPCHTNPKTFAGFQLGVRANFTDGDKWIISIPMKDGVAGNLRFLYGSRKESISDAGSYKWSSDGENWNDVTSMGSAGSDAAFKAFYFTVPEGQIPAKGTLYLSIAAHPTAGVVYFQNGFCLDYADVPMTTIDAENDTKIIISEGFDGTKDALAAMAEVTGFLGGVTSGYASAAGGTKAYVPANASITTKNCFARPGFLQVGNNDDAVTTRCGFNGTITLAVGARLKAMGIEKSSVTVQFKACGYQNAYDRISDAKIVVKSGETVVEAEGELAVGKWKNYAINIAEADQSTVLVITSAASADRKENGTAASPYESADYRFFIDDLLVVAGDAVPVTPVDPDPGTDPDPTEPKVLCFDFTGTPQAGWKTTEPDSVYPNGGSDFTYLLDGVDYVFKLSTCDVPAGSTKGPYWVAPKDDKPGYLTSYAQYRYIGVPKLSGYAVTKIVVVGGGVSLSTVQPKFCITTSIATSTTEAGAITDDSACVVKGGGYQLLEADGTGTLTYELSDTEADTMYYIYGRVKGTIGSITVTYTPSK